LIELADEDMDGTSARAGQQWLFVRWFPRVGARMPGRERLRAGRVFVLLQAFTAVARLHRRLYFPFTVHGVRMRDSALPDKAPGGPAWQLLQADTMGKLAARRAVADRPRWRRVLYERVAPLRRLCPT